MGTGGPSARFLAVPVFRDWQMLCIEEARDFLFGDIHLY
jgi:hypothetical protein